MSHRGQINAKNNIKDFTEGKIQDVARNSLTWKKGYLIYVRTGASFYMSI